MSAEKDTPDIIFDRVSATACSMCGCEIDVSEIEPFVKIECPDCGSIESVPGQLGQFLLLELLGTGGMGGVYKARDVALSRLVGIKVMLSSVGEDAQFIETFKREAQAAANLNHPNIAQIYSFGQEKGQPYIVMELVSGQHFDLMVDDAKSLDQGLIMKVGLDIALGLQAADEIGLIHGDIKPENILLDSKKNAKLVDFGIASFAHQGAQEGIWGTPYYISPEKIKKQKVDARSDMYSLGATLYHAVTKKPPFDGETPIEVVKARLGGPPPPMSKYRKSVNPRVQQIISRMLELEPSRRYPNYSSLISDLKKSVQELGGASAVGKRSKKVIVTKRATADQRSASTGATGRQPSVNTKKKKIVAPSMAKRKAMQTQRAAGAPAAGAAGATNNVQAQGRQPVKKKQKGGKARGVVFSIIGILIVVGGAVMFIQDRREKARIALIEYSTLMDQRKQAKEAQAKIKKISVKFTAMSINAINHKLKVIESVEVVTGVPMVPPPKPKKEPVKKDPPKATGGTAPAPKPAPKKPALTNTGMPSGMPTREQLDARRAREAEEATKPKEPEVVEAPEAPEEEEEAPVVVAPPVRQPRIKVLARKIIAIVDELEMNANGLEEMSINALEHKRRIDASTFTYEASPSLTQLLSDLETAQTMEATAAEQQTALNELVEEATDIRKEKDRENVARRKAEKEEADRIAAEKEAARKAKEYADLVQMERERVVSEHQNHETLIVQHNFKDAADAVKSTISEYKSKEGIKAISDLHEKYDRLEQLKQFIIKNINKKPYTWGYGSGRSARDISAADDSGITVTGLSGTITWDRVSAKQMMKIINHYLANRKMRIRTLGEMNLNTAIYCHEIAQGNASALNAAKKYVETAAQYCEDLQGRANDLLGN